MRQRITLGVTLDKVPWAIGPHRAVGALPGPAVALLGPSRPKATCGPPRAIGPVHAARRKGVALGTL